MRLAIEVKGLAKYYGDFPAVRDATFEVPRGSVFGLFGPNGAGKSTTIKVIVGLLKPSRGSVTVMGYPAGSIGAKRHIGYLPEDFSIDGRWRLIDFLEYVGLLWGMSREEAREEASRMLEWIGLKGWERERFGNLSAGMKRRLGVAQALMGSPDVVVLDEPTQNLDVMGRLEVMNKIRELSRSGGITTLVSTHVLSEAELIVDHAAIMLEGRVRGYGPVDELAGETPTFEVSVDRSDALEAHLKRLGVEVSRIGSRLIVRPEREAAREVQREILRFVLDEGLVLKRFSTRGGLMEAFMRIVGEGS